MPPRLSNSRKTSKGTRQKKLFKMHLNTTFFWNVENARVWTPPPQNVEFSTFFFFDGFPTLIMTPTVRLKLALSRSVWQAVLFKLDYIVFHMSTRPQLFQVRLSTSIVRHTFCNSFATPLIMYKMLLITMTLTLVTSYHTVMYTDPRTALYFWLLEIRLHYLEWMN